MEEAADLLLVSVFETDLVNYCLAVLGRNLVVINGTYTYTVEPVLSGHPRGMAK